MIGREALSRFYNLHWRALIVTPRKEKKKYIYIYISERIKEDASILLLRVSRISARRQNFFYEIPDKVFSLQKKFCLTSA